MFEAIRTEHARSEDEGSATGPGTLPADVPVSIVVATYDRPEPLRHCLRSLTAQRSPRPVEIIVVDNDPISALTPPVVSSFPGVVLVNEQRRGLAYARNSGIIAARGEIVVCTDDDVTAPPTWLERLVAPFADREVMAVTGNILPLELETPAQRFYEMAGGLGRGFARRVLDGQWFERCRGAVPTWTLGATANAAFRAAIFGDPAIGLMDEALGPGMPSGVGEDTYLFYKVLKSGRTLVYEPAAYVWHRHRRNMADLHRQIYRYSKGHVAYHLTTLTRDHDLRALVRLLIRLPRWHLEQLSRWALACVRRRNRYPLSLILLAIAGHLAGPWCLWRSRWRVKRQGRSAPYAPRAARS
jgi:glycosyltransferase involved in cell wall biosynthesis